MTKQYDEHADRFQRIVLRWDYWELGERLEEGKGVAEHLEKVPDTFTNLQHYLDVFSPLVLEECAAQLLSGNEEGEAMEPHPAVASAVDVQKKYTFVRLSMSPEVVRSFARNDVVLVSKDPLDGSGSDKLHALGFIDGYEGEQSLRVRMYLPDKAEEDKADVSQRFSRFRDLLVPKSCWWAMKCSNVSTVMREWSALHNVTNLPFVDTVIYGTPMRISKSTYAIPPLMKAELAQQYNDSQLAAVQAGLDGNGVVLIQGPPGTGKTRTILGLLSIIMHSAPKGSFRLEFPGSRVDSQVDTMERWKMWVEMSPWVIGGVNPRYHITPSPTACAANIFGLKDVQRPVVVGRESAVKAHVLVCAPSNSALDEIVSRVITVGLMDDMGQQYIPTIVRVGVDHSIHHSVIGVSLDAVVESRLQAKGVTGEKRSWIEVDRMKQAVLDEADIVCSTLSFSGGGVFGNMSRPFDVIVIDEAAQAVEPSILVALANKAKQVYLVGDPNQLPATVISAIAVEHTYDKSLFKRLQQAGHPVQVLDTQYRMHPAISVFPSRQFYGGTLKDAAGMHESTRRPWHDIPGMGPLAVYDVPGKEERAENSSSIQNKQEAEFILFLYRELIAKFPQLKKSGSMAVISPYKAQVKLLRDKFSKALGNDWKKFVDVNTIDGFQGREKDIAIFSTVRTTVKRRIGFVGDERRINVGLTRARSALIVVGNCKALAEDFQWITLIKHATKTKCLWRAFGGFQEFLAKVFEGSVRPVAPTIKEQQEDWTTPQAEEAVLDVEDHLYSDDDTEAAPAPAPTPRAAAKRKAPDGGGRGGAGRRGGRGGGRGRGKRGRP